MKSIDKSTRLTNYLNDFILIYILWYVLIVIINGSNYFSLFYLTTFVYYLVLEYVFQQTIGKMVTKTKVIYNQEGKPGIFRTILRSLFRLVPIDVISYLFGTEIGIHDSWSFTRIVYVNEN